MNSKITCILICIILATYEFVTAQQLNWNKDGNSYTTLENNSIVQVTLPSMAKTTLVNSEQLNAAGALRLSKYMFSADQQVVLLFTNPRRDYHNTFFTCWVYNRKSNKLSRIAKNLGESSLLNAKVSPDGNMVAFVYNSNIYVEDLNKQLLSQLTKNGSEKILNGWFDYVYSEELFLTDGLRWSPDSRHIAFWQMDASRVKTFYMINNTDSNYSKPIPVVFSKPGEPIAEAKIGTINITSKKIQWIKISGDPAAYYIPRMEWTVDGSKLIFQQLNRAQNESKTLLGNPVSGESTIIHTDNDEAWVDIKAFWNRAGAPGWDWVRNGNAFILSSEKDGWRHLYKVTLDGRETLLTKGDYDVTAMNGWDEQGGWLYFTASPGNATQRYLYRSKLDGSGSAERLTPDNLTGTNSYSLSINGKWAQHNFSSHLYQQASEWISLPDNKPLNDNESIAKKLLPNSGAKNITLFTVTTDDGIKMDGWMVKPVNFDSSKKYPVIFTTYSEPFSTTVNDVAGIGGRGGFFNVDSGYIFISVEGRGAPAPKGRAWRKAIYRNLGWTNIIDQAMAAKKILQWPFIDPSRVAVFGGSGGGSTTMHLLFRYPGIYKVGISSSGVPSQLIYNNIYEERFMGLLPQNKEDYIRGSPVTYAKNLQGHLLILHGTGDHNVHYQGEEMLLNELIKYNRQFVFMPYPNRTHGISEGEGTGLHRSTLSAEFLKQYCPPGGR